MLQLSSTINTALIRNCCSPECSVTHKTNCCTQRLAAKRTINSEHNYAM